MLVLQKFDMLRVGGGELGGGVGDTSIISQIYMSCIILIAYGINYGVIDGDCPGQFDFLIHDLEPGTDIMVEANIVVRKQKH